jgi:hypothetical protein
VVTTIRPTIFPLDQQQPHEQDCLHLNLYLHLTSSPKYCLIDHPNAKSMIDRHPPKFQAETEAANPTLAVPVGSIADYSSGETVPKMDLGVVLPLQL